jgi:hypothetical protein
VNIHHHNVSVLVIIEDALEDIGKRTGFSGAGAPDDDKVFREKIVYL